MAVENLKIMAYEKPVNNTGGTTYRVGIYTVMFNPSTFTVTNKIDYNTEQGKGKEGTEPVFEKIPPREFSLDFTIDGTGLYTDKVDVAENVDLFMSVTGAVKGKIHRPNYLAISWGNFFIRCILTASSVNYTLFDKSGIPLRAKITASFTERTDLEGKAKEQQLSSPDMTHYQQIVEGDTLYGLCYSVYEEPAYYLDVARANKLKDFRRLALGSRLILPPVENQ